MGPWLEAMLVYLVMGALTAAVLLFVVFAAYIPGIINKLGLVGLSISLLRVL